MSDSTQTKSEDLAKGSIRRFVRNAGRTLAAVWPEGAWRLFGMLSLAIVTAIMPVMDARIWAIVINTIQGGEHPAWLHSLVWAAIILGLVVPICYSFRYLLERRNWHSVTRQFELMVADKKTKLDLATYDSKKAQSIFAIYQQEGSYRVANFVLALSTLAWAGTAALIALAVLTWELTTLAPDHVWLCLLVFGATLPVLLIELWSGNELWGIHSARGFTKRRFWHLMGLFGGTSSLGEMKTYQSGGHFLGHLKGLFGRFENEELGVEWKKLCLSITAQIFYQGVYAYILFSLLSLAVSGRIQLGSFGFLLALVATYRVSLTAFFSDLGRMRDHERFVDNIWQLLDLRPSLIWPEKGEKPHEATGKDLVFNGVQAGYLDQDGKPFAVLQGLDLTVRQGEKIAIVGANGAGKSTLRKLLERNFDPQDGTVSIGGVKLCEMDEATLYHAVTFLGQESMPIYLSAREVIAAGYPNAPIDEEKLRRAAQVAGAASFIEDPKVMPDGYDNLVGKPDGCGLSGGQMRRLAIARAVYRLLMADPDIVVLDEATSQVDGAAAADFYAELREMTKGKTVIVISHQLADIKECADRIVVLDHGAIVEEGSHTDLMNARGAYYRLFNRQELERQSG